MPLDNAQDRPSVPRFEYTLWAPDGLLIRRLIGGTRTIHSAYTDYVGKYSSENADNYRRRATSTKLYGGLARTLSASTGMLFAKPPERIDRWTPELEEHAENIDGKGTHLDVFVKRTAEDAIADGFCATLVDFPAPPPGVIVTAANEKALNLRPLWSRYQRADILSWRTDVINNVETLTQVVLREGAATNEGRFGSKLKVLYRVCSLDKYTADDGATEYAATWRLLEEQKSDSGGTVNLVEISRGEFRDKTGQPFQEIPLAISYAGRTDAILTAHPPLLDVAWANLEHWRVATNIAFLEEKCCYPQPTVEGELLKDAQGLPIPFQVGPSVLVQVTTGSKFYWSEIQGTSLAQLRESLQERKQEIADLGMSFLAKHTRGVETAEAKRLDATAENSTLATAAQGIEDGINQALVLHARYLGIESEQAPTIMINRDFEQQVMDPGMITALVGAVANAGLPPRILTKAMQAGQVIAPDEDLDLLDAEMSANAAAIDEQQLLEDAARGVTRTNGQARKKGPVNIEYDANGRPSRLVPSEN